MQKQMTRIDSLEDFALLNGGLDVINLNGASVLFLRLDARENPVIARRIDGDTIAEAVVNRDRLTFNDGSLVANGSGALAQTRYFRLGTGGMAVLNMPNDEYRAQARKYDKFESQLKGAGL